MDFMTGYVLGGVSARSAANTQDTVLHFKRLRQNRRIAQTVAAWQQHAAGLEASARHLDEQLTIAEGMLSRSQQQLQQAAADRQALEQRLAHAEALAAGWEANARKYLGEAKDWEKYALWLKQEVATLKAAPQASNTASPPGNSPQTG